MLTKVEVRTSLGGLLTLTLADSSAGYIVEDIQGLDPVNATLVSSSVANFDGEQYQSARRVKRNILLKLGFDVNWAAQSIRGLRNALYRYFMSKTQVNLRFFLSNENTVEIDGIVEYCQSTLFAEEPVVDVSILCFDPDFLELEAVEIEGDTVNDSEEFLVEYTGSVDTGILFTLLVDRELSEFTIYHRPGDNQVRTFEMVADLEADDILRINTNRGQKEVILTRDSVESSLLYGRTSQSNWISLMPGDNYIRVFADGVPIPFTIEYFTRHGGL